MSTWPIYKKNAEPHDGIAGLDDPPPWRSFDATAEPVTLDLGEELRGAVFQVDDQIVDLVNAALYLRRPLLVTGKPGTGKSSLAASVAYQLQLGRVLTWPINTRSTLQEGLYRYDAIARLQDASLYGHSGRNGRGGTGPPAAGGKPSQRPAQGGAQTEPDIGRYIQLGALGTALLPSLRPRVLLIDEIDKSDIDLPNDLLNVFETGHFEIPELARLPEEPRYQVVEVQPFGGGPRVPIRRGEVSCRAFPFVVLTSNGEREFPPAFLRRCIHVGMPEPDAQRLSEIVNAHLRSAVTEIDPLIASFMQKRSQGELATDQLLNAIYLRLHGIDPLAASRETLAEALLRPLDAVTGQPSEP